MTAHLTKQLILSRCDKIETLFALRETCGLMTPSTRAIGCWIDSKKSTQLSTREGTHSAFGISLRGGASCRRFREAGLGAVQTRRRPQPKSAPPSQGNDHSALNVRSIGRDGQEARTAELRLLLVTQGLCQNLNGYLQIQIATNAVRVVERGQCLAGLATDRIIMAWRHFGHILPLFVSFYRRRFCLMMSS